MLYNIITLCISYSFITHDDIFEKYIKKTSSDTSDTQLPIRATVNSEKIREGFIFAKLREIQVTMSVTMVTDVGKSCHHKICLLPVTLFAIKKTFMKLQYSGLKQEKYQHHIVVHEDISRTPRGTALM